jgi:hypothetical protein
MEKDLNSGCADTEWDLGASDRREGHTLPLD